MTDSESGTDRDYGRKSEIDLERRLWRLCVAHADGEPGRPVSVSLLAVTHLSMRKQRAREIVRDWENRGLVAAHENATRAVIRSEAVGVDDPTEVDSEM